MINSARDPPCEKPREREDRSADRENIGPHLREGGKTSRIGRKGVGRENARGRGWWWDVLRGRRRARHRGGKTDRGAHEENLEEREFTKTGAHKGCASREHAPLHVTAHTENEKQRRLREAELPIWMRQEFAECAQAREEREHAREGKADPREEREGGETLDRAPHFGLIVIVECGEELQHQEGPDPHREGEEVEEHRARRTFVAHASRGVPRHALGNDRAEGCEGCGSGGSRARSRYPDGARECGCGDRGNAPYAKVARGEHADIGTEVGRK